MKEWQCNIQRRGRIIRGGIGVIFLGAGVYLLLNEKFEFWAIGLCVFGIFCLLEALVGWCAIRALGIGTPF